MGEMMSKMIQHKNVKSALEQWHKVKPVGDTYMVLRFSPLGHTDENVFNTLEQANEFMDAHRGYNGLELYSPEGELLDECECECH